MTDYTKLLSDSENWLINRILEYAIKFEFTKYTSTLREAWLFSIRGLTDSLIAAAEHYGNNIPEFHPDDKYNSDPITEFGIIEAKKHRQRGTTLGMFLGLMKYYKDCYNELIELSVSDQVKKQFYLRFTNRCFERIEIAYCIGWSGHNRDNYISELQDNNRNMTNEKNKFLTIFESLHVPVILLDDSLRITNLNQAAAELFIDINATGPIYSNDLSNLSVRGLNKQIMNLFKDYPVDSALETHLTTTRGKLLFQVRSKKMQDVSKKFSGTVIMFDDISVRKQNELTILNQNQELIKMNADKDIFLSILSHDLKSPFNSLIGYSEILAEKSRHFSVDKIEDFAKNINISAQNAYNLLEDILMWVGTQRGNIPYKPQNLGFEEICRDTVRILYPNAKAKNIAINFPSASHLNIYADGNMIKTVLRNLISNAIKFTNRDGVIKISAEEDSENVLITVSDDGIGIASVNLKKLFDLTKIRTTRGTGKETGTGMGLMICKEFVEIHGGKIWAESESGKGSAFKFTLPVSCESGTFPTISKN
jgi:signal transduction histidine kinase